MAVSAHDNSIFVLIHGAVVSGAAWNETAGFLRDYGYTVYAPDLPGHGQDGRDIREMNLTAYAKDVAGLITELKKVNEDRQIILVGHSMGGAVISMVGELIPEKIHKLVYIGAWLLEDGMSCNGIGSSYEPHDYHLSQDGITVREYELGDELPKHIPEVKDPKRREAIAALHERIHVTDERWGSIRRYYVKTLRDRAIQPWKQEIMIEKMPCEAVYEIDTGHNAAGEKPQELADILNRLA